MFNGKNILITGGTGSFGKKYTQILLEKYNPNKILYIAEMSLNSMRWLQSLTKIVCDTLLEDVRNCKRV